MDEMKPEVMNALEDHVQEQDGRSLKEAILEAQYHMIESRAKACFTCQHWTSSDKQDDEALTGLGRCALIHAPLKMKMQGQYCVRFKRRDDLR